MLVGRGDEPFPAPPDVDVPFCAVVSSFSGSVLSGSGCCGTARPPPSLHIATSAKPEQWCFSTISSNVLVA